MSLSRLPAAMSRFCLSTKAFSMLTSEKQWVVHRAARDDEVFNKLHYPIWAELFRPECRPECQ
jgi:hypothetical protein